MQFKKKFAKMSPTISECSLPWGTPQPGIVSFCDSRRFNSHSGATTLWKSRRERKTGLRIQHISTRSAKRNTRRVLGDDILDEIEEDRLLDELEEEEEEEEEDRFSMS